MCLQSSGQSLRNVCNYLCIQMVASSVHVGSRFRPWGCCIALIKPCHMLSTGYSRDPMSWNGKSGHSQIPCNWLILPFQPCFTLVPLCPFMHFQPNLYFFLYILCFSASLLLSKLFFPCALTFLACQYPFSPLHRAANYFSFKSKQKVCIGHSLMWYLSRKWPVLLRKSYSPFLCYIMVIYILGYLRP